MGRLVRSVLRGVAALGRLVSSAGGAAARVLRELAHEIVVRLRNRSSFLHKFSVGLVLGLGIEALLHAVHDHPRVVAVEDDVMDWSMALLRGADPQRPDPVGFTVVDIDEATFREWGAPALVPRDHLARLIEGVAAANPALLIVDVDLAGPELTPGDRVLFEAIAGYEDRSRGLLGRVPPLLLVRGFEPIGVRADADCVVPWPSFLDSAVAGREAVAFASALFQRDPDWAVRRWRLWERVCEEHVGEAGGAVVPSLQLLVAALLAEPDRSPRSLLVQIEEELRGAPPYLDVAAGPAEAHGVSPAALRIGTLDLSLPPSRPNQRILYRYPGFGALRAGERYPKDLVWVVSAGPLAGGEAASRELIEGRIAVIGGSFEAGRDLHQTPLGVMPGAFVIVNAIDSLSEHGEIRTPARGWVIVIVVFEILLISAIFARFHSVTAPLVAGAVLLVTLVPVSLLLFQDGYWLNFGLPLLAVQAHQTTEKLREIGAHLRAGGDHDAEREA